MTTLPLFFLAISGSFPAGSICSVVPRHRDKSARLQHNDKYYSYVEIDASIERERERGKEGGKERGKEGAIKGVREGVREEGCVKGFSHLE